MPAALHYLADENQDVRFDAIIVDEAQDFSGEFWLPLETMMADLERTPLYLFYDSNQQIYRRSKNFPIKPEEEFPLTENCRNTAAIHATIRPLFTGGELNAPPLDGVPVSWHPAETLHEQTKLVRVTVQRMVSDDKLSVNDVVILVTDARLVQGYLNGLSHGGPLHGGIHFAKTASPTPSTVRVETAARFKGLEAPVVIVCGLDSLNPTDNEARMTLYVALSRPKSELHLVGASAALAKIRALQSTTGT